MPKSRNQCRAGRTVEPSLMTGQAIRRKRSICCETGELMRGAKQGGAAYSREGESAHWQANRFVWKRGKWEKKELDQLGSFAGSLRFLYPGSKDCRLMRPRLGKTCERLLGNWRRSKRPILPARKVASGSTEKSLARSRGVGIQKRVIVVDIGERSVGLVNPTIAAAQGEPLGLAGRGSDPVTEGE
jgi:hypothetical protein